MKKYIPNTLTCLNLFSGCTACIMAFEGNFQWVVFWIMIATIFDFLDGFSARLLHAYSSIGKELDSLADMVSFGVAPALATFKLLSMSDVISQSPWGNILPYFSFLLAIFSGLRLAKFNVDERQTSSFIGLPTPANALFWICFCFGLSKNTLLDNGFFVIVCFILILAFSLLMTSEIPMFSLKVNNLKWRGNEFRYLLLISIIILVACLGVLGISFGIIFYILLSIFISKKSRNSTQNF